MSKKNSRTSPADLLEKNTDEESTPQTEPKKSKSITKSIKKTVSKRTKTSKEKHAQEKSKKHFQSVKQEMSERKSKGGFNTVRVIAVGLLSPLLVVGIGFGIVYAHHLEAKEKSLGYFQDNDYRRGEQLQAALSDQDIQPEAVVTHYDLRRPVYSLVYSNPVNPDQQFVEVTYLKWSGWLDYEPIKSFRVIVDEDLQTTKDLAIEYDLHLEDAALEESNVVRLQDLDIPQDQRDQAQRQLEVQAENQRRAVEFDQADTAGKIEILKNLRLEAQNLKDAIERGDTEYQGEVIPPAFDTTQIDTYLRQLDQNISDLEQNSNESNS